MKGTALLLAGLAGVVIFSCRKERTCECEIDRTFSPANGGAVQTDNYTTKFTKKEQRKNEFRYSEKCYYYTKTYAIETPTLVAGNYVDQYKCEMK
jgi:hypothetical protein